MITPHYRTGPTQSTEDKIYCGYTEVCRGLKFSRYLTPTGWSVVAHYFDTREEAESVFEKFKKDSCRLEVTTEEYDNEKSFRDWYDRDQMDDYMREELDRQ